MDISNAILAKSDQVNAIDLTGASQTVTVISVSEGNAEQKVNIVTDVFGPSRPFKPSKTVLRVLAGAWGLETSAWVGRRMTIYRDPSVRWAGEEVGGIRISGLSHIDKPLTFVLPTSKGKTAKTIIQPLPDAAPTRDWLAELTLAGDDLDALEALGIAASRARADDNVITQIRAKYTAVKANTL